MRKLRVPPGAVPTFKESHKWTVDIITRAELITRDSTFDQWIGTFTPSSADGHDFYALSLDSMRAIFDSIRDSSPKRPIGFGRPR